MSSFQTNFFFFWPELGFMPTKIIYWQVEFLIGSDKSGSTLFQLEGRFSFFEGITEGKNGVLLKRNKRFFSFFFSFCREWERR